MTLPSVGLTYAFSSRRCSSRHPIAVLGLAVVVALLTIHGGDRAAEAQQRGSVINTERGQADAHNGNYYALIIGINQYPSGMDRLQTAVNDAKGVGRLLQAQYGFQVEYLLDKDATRFKILEHIKKLRTTLDEDDNLLIYYGGHGYFDKDADKGYWLPVDAESAASPNVIMADDLTSEIRALPSRHVLIVSDSCYSGDLSRDAHEPPPPVIPTPRYLLKVLHAKSRTVMASGGDEPVSDSGADGHSVFAFALINALQNYPNPAFSADELFYASIRNQVAGNSNQIPKYTHIRNSGDADGDFIFTRKGAHIDIAASGETTGSLTRSATTETASVESAPPEPVAGPVANIPNYSNVRPVPSHSISAQDTTAKIRGHVQDPANAPIVNVQVILSTDGKTPLFTFTTDANGDYKGEGIRPGTYYVTLFSAPGKAIDRFDNVKFSTATDTLQDFDLSRAEYVNKLPPEQKKALAEAKAKNAEISKENQNVGKLNDLLKQARADNQAKKYDEAATLMHQATTIKPEAAVLWLELGIAQTGLKQWDDATTSLKKALDLDATSKHPNPEIEAADNNALGEVYADSNKIPNATASYDAAAKLQPANAAIYYTNETIVLSRTGQTDATIAAADKAIAADPNKPIPYYLKGQALIQKATVDPKTQKIVAPPGTAEAYNKYLELAPNGPMAPVARSVLAEIGEKVNTKYSAGKKN